MSDFNSGGRYTSPTDRDDKDKQVLIGKVEDVKPAAETGKKRVIVREQKGRRLAHAVDVPMRNMRNIERKECYKFLVEEKERESQYGYAREKKSGSKNYRSDDKPELWGMGSLRDEKNNRFGGVGRRTQFPKG